MCCAKTNKPHQLAVAAHEVTSKLTQMTRHVTPENVVDHDALRRAMNVNTDALAHAARKRSQLEALRQADSQSDQVSQPTNQTATDPQTFSQSGDASSAAVEGSGRTVDTNEAVMNIPTMEIKTDNAQPNAAASSSSVLATAAAEQQHTAGDLDETAAAVAGIL